jgi:uncharacterized protein (DUF433 family)
MALTDTLVPHAPPLRVVEGGAIRVGNTRVSLDSVIFAFENGATAEEIMQRFPSLKLVDIYGTIAYYLEHRDEVLEYLARRDKEAEEIREKVEAKFPATDLRNRLMKRAARRIVGA